MNRISEILLAILAWAIVSWGQPAWSLPISIAVALGGYALFWRVLLECPEGKKRFWWGVLWFTAVQLVQLSWFVSHPYIYIYGLWFLFSFLMGLQFGLLCVFIQPAQFKSIFRLAAIAGLGALLEWSRVYFLSGFTWNPSGLALSSSVYALQSAALVGVYGLSFWVYFVNLLALKMALELPRLKGVVLWGSAAALPFLYGAVHLSSIPSSEKPYKALLVQTAFPVEEIIEFSEPPKFIAYVIDEWKTILRLAKPHAGKPLDLIALPEFTVPLGTYTFVYPYPIVANAFHSIYGSSATPFLPPLEYPYAEKKGDHWFVNNAFWAQGISNYYNAEVAIGLEDVEENPLGTRDYYSSAILFFPRQTLLPSRYEKRVLVPMGEYIPFAFCKKLAESYGIFGSFTPGTSAKALGDHKLGFSICYEETFSDLMRENKLQGAEILVNLTSDVWYPDSKLPRQHLEHARLRTVENGLPLLRACNTGVTCALDSSGRTVAALPETDQWLADALYVELPTHTYSTLYSHTGDNLVVAFSFILGLFFLRFRKE